MFLRKRRNGFYHVYYKGTDGKRKVLTTKRKTKSEALDFLTDFKIEVEKRNSNEIQPTTLYNFRFLFLKHAELIKSYKTMKVYKTTFNFFLNYFPNANVDTISTSDIKKFIEHRLSTSSVFSARKDLINLKAAFRYAIDENLVRTNPCVGIKQFKLPEKQPLYFSKDDFTKLLKVIDDPEFRNLVTIAANTGLRQMELLNLTWQQINLETRNILLDNRNHITKSKKIRSVPINDNILPILTEIKKNSSREKVFSYNGRNMDVIVSQRFKSYVKKANLNPELHYHSLRHTFASWLIQNGTNIYYVSKLLGHADIKTTEIYAHLRRDELLESVNGL